MSKYIFKTPEGTRDLLFAECEIHNLIKQKLSLLFSSRGYHEVITPALEYYNLFSLNTANFEQKDMFKLTEQSGNLLVLRPDMTMPIARVSATRLKGAPLPLRLYYIQKVYRVNQGYKGRSNEITQAGIEILGSSGLLSDLEVLTTASKALNECGIERYNIEIGHAGIFKKLTCNLPVDEFCIEDIRQCIETKNYGALESVLNNLQRSPVVDAIKMLPKLFGGREVLKQAEELLGDIAGEELNYLNKLMDLLEPELKQKINLDLGLVHRNNYYSGMVFRGYITGSGDTVVSGGRYDNLLSEFGIDLPAIGFAVDLETLSEVLMSNTGHKISKTDIIVFAKDGFEIKALAFMDEMIEKGNTCEILAYQDKDIAFKQAEIRKANTVAVVGDTIDTFKLI